MDTIHCFGCRVDTTDVGPINQATLLNPPVIFVGTHKDKLQVYNIFKCFFFVNVKWHFIQIAFNS